MILIDTNILLTKFLDRESKDKEQAFIRSHLAEGSLVLLSSQFRDIHYVLRRHGFSESDVRMKLSCLQSAFKVLPLTSQAVMLAYSSPMGDFEDAILVEACKEYHVASIYTENAKDFVLSGLKIINALA
jgi:predicted nucleic acid-binding protein